MKNRIFVDVFILLVFEHCVYLQVILRLKKYSGLTGHCQEYHVWCAWINCNTIYEKFN